MGRKFVQWRVPLCLLLAACSESSVQVVDGDGPARVSLDRAVVRVVTGNDQEGVVATVLPRSLMVEVVDTLGNALPNAPVRWSFGAGVGMSNGQPTADSLMMTTTDMSGRATVDWQLGTRSGEQTAWAELDMGSSSSDASLAPKNDNGKKVGFRARGRAAEPAEIRLSHAQLELSVGEEVEISAVVVDRYGNLVEGAEVTFTSSDESVVTVHPSTDAAASALSTPRIVSADPSPAFYGESSTDPGQTPRRLESAVSVFDRLWGFIQ
jgi:hypothetical protein